MSSYLAPILRRKNSRECQRPRVPQELILSCLPTEILPKHVLASKLAREKDQQFQPSTTVAQQFGRSPQFHPHHSSGGRMHKFSRTLLVAGVLAFGTLSAACGDKVTVAGTPTGVQSISVTPPSATINVGESISLAASVTADAATAKTVTWASSSAATAT